MTPGRLGEILGLPPIPQGTWAEEALYVSPAALRRGEAPGEMAARLRALPGIADVRVRADGFLEIAVTVPGELVVELTGTVSPDSPASTAPPASPALPDTAVSPWTDAPGTWSNPGFVVKYAHVRAVAVRRWAAELGVGGRFRPESLDGRWDRAVLRLLAEVHGRRASRDPGWAAYTERLALAYHDAFERAAVLPMGDEEPSPLHTARVELARAVRAVLAEGLAALGETAPDRL
ncbi:DALR anticodon-binding domain-containing protein [Streptosporangium sp. 'caverna']|uniref:DALR anticodon-binding domain-containing protein n=1 Tax=Streptosporangium sp. 'caverna' TaxID=2202249 RepID=UPI000D7D6836|nr:DALR anticodon-binding domain-containing protein [Streptosporangium sp. 'caverna']AWS41069.1 anticodon-binding protein [Streptosporangium sp. 'caverna']